MDTGNPSPMPAFRQPFGSWKIERVDSRQDTLYNHSERKGGVFHRDSKHEKPVIQVFE